MKKNFLKGRSEKAWKRAQLIYSPRQTGSWRNEVAAQLNVILGRVQYEMETCLPPDETDVEFAEAALAIVERVADFEDIERLRPPAPKSVPLSHAIDLRRDREENGGEMM